MHLSFKTKSHLLMAKEDATTGKPSQKATGRAHASLFFSGLLIMKYLLSVSSSRFVLSSIRLELLKNNRLFVLIFHSNYLLSAFSGVMWFIQLGKIIYNELPSSLHLFV